MDGDANGISLINWNSVCIPREWGGLGVSDLQIRNISLLLRWWGQLYIDTNGLWKNVITVLKGMGNVAQGPKLWIKKGSFFWAQMQKLKRIFDRCCSWNIGDGRTISFWFDNWWDTEIIEAFTDIARPPRRSISLREALPTLENVATQIFQSLTQQISNSKDELYWRWGTKNEYSASSAYKTMISGGKIAWRYMAIWKCKAPPNAKVFAYLLLKDKNLTHEVMIRRGFNVAPQCHTCTGDYPETLLHLFFMCTYAQEVWSYVSNELGHVLFVEKNSVTEIWDASVREARRSNGLTKTEWAPKFICVCWHIWKQRNARIFRGE